MWDLLCVFFFNEGRVVFTNLIAGYVRTVAILLEIAPSKKAEKAERDSGEDPFPAFFIFPSKSLCFS